VRIHPLKTRLRSMDSADTVRLELMLHSDLEPLRGFVREGEDCEWRAVTGWLGLARELQRACDRQKAGVSVRVEKSRPSRRPPTRLES